MSKVALGERDALATLVERYHSLLLGYLYRLLSGDRTLAEDLTQETFVRLLKSHNYQAHLPFRPWLYAIATNLVRDHFKSAFARHVIPDSSDRLDLSGDKLVSGEPDPVESVLARERGTEIAQAIGLLAPEYREALLLRFYGELSLQEIAQSLDVPVGTVKSRLSVGCRRLRDLVTRSIDGTVELTLDNRGKVK